LAPGGVVAVVDSSRTVTDAPSHPFEVTGEHPEGDTRIKALIEVIEVIRPVIAADGGSLDMLGVDVDAGIVRLQLSGACGSCAVSAATLNDGINRILRDRLSWVTEVIGGIEESEMSGMGGWTPKHS
jgi:Fe-S cluster biogenesis protein NfuA